MYVVDMMTVSHIAMTASSYLITFAAVERYCITVSSGMVDFLQKNRKFFVAFAVLFGIVSKGTIKLEIDVCLFSFSSEDEFRFVTMRTALAPSTNGESSPPSSLSRISTIL